LTEAYLRWPDISADLRSAIQRVRTAFIPQLDVLQASYVNEAKAAIDNKIDLVKLENDLKSIPIAGGMSLYDWCTGFIGSGDAIAKLLGERAAKPANSAHRRSASSAVSARRSQMKSPRTKPCQQTSMQASSAISTSCTTCAPMHWLLHTAPTRRYLPRHNPQKGTAEHPRTRPIGIGHVRHHLHVRTFGLQGVRHHLHVRTVGHKGSSPSPRCANGRARGVFGIIAVCERSGTKCLRHYLQVRTVGLRGVQHHRRVRTVGLHADGDDPSRQSAVISTRPPREKPHSSA
jgi:hypothetical protein